MKRKLPKLKTNKQAEKFVESSDLTKYDLSQMRRVRFEFQSKTERVNMRMPKLLLDTIKKRAKKAGIPYQRFIRQTLEAAITDTKA